MYSPKKKLQIPEDFHFPFTPYKIQQDLMQSLYQVIENKKIGIIESPTGTGKSLTLTCGALKWLLDHEDLVKNEINARIVELSEEIKKLEHIGEKTSDWIEAQFGANQKKDEAASLKKMKLIMEEYEKKLLEMKEKITKQKKERKINFSTKIGENTKTEEEDLSFEDVDDDDDESKQAVEDHEDEDEHFKDIKIYFCSRTHSQLSQVVREIKRTFYGKQIRCISLASRQNLCVNASVKRLSSATLINERCLEMQKSQSKATNTDSHGHTQKKSRIKQGAHCPYKNQTAVDELSENSLVEILDIEELVTAGEYTSACPYYSARAAAKDAQLIMLPYQMLLHKKTRLQTGIDLKNSVVIIDEAHNLLDTISSIYSSEVSLFQLQTAVTQLTAYKSKYFNRFNTKNLLTINQLIFVTKRLVKLLVSTDSSIRMIKTHELMSEGEFFNIDLYQILQFCEDTRFAQKVHGLAQKMAKEPVLSEKENEISSSTTTLLKKLEEQARKCKKSSKCKDKEPTENDETPQKDNHDNDNKISSVIRPLLAFLESLTECADDGMVLLNLEKDVKKACMKFILLNPGGHFGEIVRQCRSIIIAGGTMQPVSDLMDQLFKTCPERVSLHLYDHVVSNEAVLPFAVQKGPTGKRFLFNYSNRNSDEMLLELGMTLSNICNVVPAGVVCFFCSYDYLDTVFTHLKNHGILSKIETKKHIFREPHSSLGSQSLEKVLMKYANAVRDPERNGAILFSVVGGRLSEGLNFSDNLGRCVIVVGMPYPNKNSTQLQEKMKYLECNLGKGAGNEYYDNLCLKAVNQCIGRSVRHINDYACVLLLDERYTSDRVILKLPKWISRSLKTPAHFGMIQSTTAKFFKDKQNISLP